MSAIEHEVASQPDVWLRAARLDANGRLPPHGTRVLAIGCGTSYYVAQAYAAARESVGLGETDAFSASELPAGRRYDSVLAISRSGTTTEVRDALETLNGAAPVTLVTADAGTPLADAAD